MRPTSGVTLSMCCTFIGGDHVDVGLQQFHDVLVAFAMLAAVDVGVRQFIHQHHLRLARQDGIDVHLFEHRALVFELLSRYRLQPRWPVRQSPARPWVSTTPITTSSPRLCRRMPSLSML